MPDTSALFRTSDDARAELEQLDRKIAEAKDACRAAIQRLTLDARIQYGIGRCFDAVLEAIDDLAAERREPIRKRVEEADIAIEDAERAA